MSKEMTRAEVEIKVGGSHGLQALPDGYQAFLEEQLTLDGLPHKFVATLGRALPASGATQHDFRAIRVDGHAVVITAQCGNNETRREFRLTSSEIEPEVVMERINALRGDTPPPEGDGTDNDEGAGGNNSPATPDTPWFLDPIKVEKSIIDYLLAIKTLVGGSKGVAHDTATQAVKLVAPRKPRDRNKNYGDILGYLVNAGLLDREESGIGKAHRRFYSITPSGIDAIVAKASEPIPPIPTPPTPAPVKTNPSLIDHAKEVMEERLRQAEELEQLIATVEPISLTMNKVRDLRRDVTKREEDLAAKREEIAELEDEISTAYDEIVALEETLTPEARANYNLLKSLVPIESVAGNGDTNHDSGES